jgi:hypothetical protein
VNRIEIKFKVTTKNEFLMNSKSSKTSVLFKKNKGIAKKMSKKNGKTFFTINVIYLIA